MYGYIADLPDEQLVCVGYDSEQSVLLFIQKFRPAVLQADISLEPITSPVIFVREIDEE